MVARARAGASSRLLYSPRMFANLVRAALAAEFAAWTVLGAWLLRRRDWGPVEVLAGIAAGALGVRLVLVCASLGLSWLARSPRGPAERLGIAASLALVGGEWRAMLANNFLWLPFERTVLRADPPPAPCALAPVILVHGYLSNRGTLCGLARALDAAGVAPVFVPSLPAVFAPVETFAAHLAEVVEEVVAASGQPRVILVCHSMGGLAARAYLREHGPARVAGLVSLGSPHHGTALAAMAAGANGRQMRRDSEFLRGLERAEGEAGPGCEALSIYTVHDNLVAPQDSSRLAWARNVSVHGVAHVAMLLDARVHRAVLGEIARLRAGPAR